MVLGCCGKIQQWAAITAFTSKVAVSIIVVDINMKNYEKLESQSCWMAW